ncbi:hypothetical protein PHOSAC3_90748 [Mesotoga infera]|nr:hypothetical protein PHOSAC3_90748 [Mesotoga infera]
MYVKEFETHLLTPVEELGIEHGLSGLVKRNGLLYKKCYGAVCKGYHPV